MAFSVVSNKSGKTYFLHGRNQQLKGGQQVVLYYFAGEAGQGALDALPGLALDLAKRLLAGYEPPPEVVSRLCHEALTELFPERDNLELTVSPRDAAFLEELKPDWLAGYPGIRVRTDATLVPGDCQVRSRFGLTDARQKTKLAALTESLQPA